MERSPKGAQLRAYPLGQEGLGFVRGELEDGGPLAELLIGSLGHGTIWTYWPTEPRFANARQLKWAGSLERQGSEANQKEVTNFIIRYLEAANAHLALFEDHLRRPADPAVQGRDFREYRNALYYPVWSKNGQTAPIVSRAMKWASAYPWIALLTEGRAQEFAANQIEEGRAQAAATATHHVIVGAFDMDGFVIWSRHGMPASEA